MFLSREKQNKKEKVRVHALISGKVQGVFFRGSAKEKAEKLGISGWIKNLRDGRVEAIFEGDKENINKMIEWAKKGPIGAKIEDFNLSWEDYKGDFSEFSIEYDI